MRNIEIIRVQPLGVVRVMDVFKKKDIQEPNILFLATLSVNEIKKYTICSLLYNRDKRDTINMNEHLVSPIAVKNRKIELNVFRLLRESEISISEFRDKLLFSCGSYDIYIDFLEKIANIHGERLDDYDKQRIKAKYESNFLNIDESDFIAKELIIQIKTCLKTGDLVPQIDNIYQSNIDKEIESTEDYKRRYDGSHSTRIFIPF